VAGAARDGELEAVGAEETVVVVVAGGLARVTRWPLFAAGVGPPDRGGANLAVTAIGSPESPIRCAASRLADHATAAVAMIPTKAAVNQSAVRRVMLSSP